MRKRIQEHDREIRFARTQTSAVSERSNETGHIPIWSKVKFIDRDPHWYTRGVKETIHIILRPSNINIDGGIKKKSADMCGSTTPLTCARAINYTGSPVIKD